MKPIYDPSKLTINRKRFTMTKGEVELIYDGKRIAQYGDTFILTNGEWCGLPDHVWHHAARRWVESDPSDLE